MRSRLEARWAIFFDALGYRWRYEPTLRTGVSYLPDFALDDFGVTVEVKYGPELPTLDDDLLAWGQFVDRLGQLDRHHDLWQRFVDITGLHHWICIGQPVTWIEGRPARPAAVLIYRPHRIRYLRTWSEGVSAPAPLGTLTEWHLGATMISAASAVRDFAFLDEAA